MKSAHLFAIGVAMAAILSVPARADTIFDVEHARANYRAGLTSEDDVELLRRWGAPSGYYPQAPYFYEPSRRWLRLQRDWRDRR
jgi:hypothetical protein